MSEGTTVKCPICGEPYKFMPFYAGDQSACPSCVAKAEKNTFAEKISVQGIWENPLKNKGK